MLNGLRPHGICNKKLWDSSAANPRSPWCRGLPFVKVTKCADPQAFNLKNKSKLKYFWALRREKRETKSTRSKKMEEATKGSPANFILAPSCTSASQKCWHIIDKPEGMAKGTSRERQANVVSSSPGRVSSFVFEGNILNHIKASQRSLAIPSTPCYWGPSVHDQKNPSRTIPDKANWSGSREWDHELWRWAAKAECMIHSQLIIIDFKVILFGSNQKIVEHSKLTSGTFAPRSRILKRKHSGAGSSGVKKRWKKGKRPPETCAVSQV